MYIKLHPKFALFLCTQKEETTVKYTSNYHQNLSLLYTQETTYIYN